MDTNTKIKNLGTTSKKRFSLETGTIPDGVTASNSKYSINSSNVSIDNPNFPMGPTQTELLSVLVEQPYVIDINAAPLFQVGISGDWKNLIKPGDSVILERGSIQEELTVAKPTYSFAKGITKLAFSAVGVNYDVMNPFVGLSGYPYPAKDSYLRIDTNAQLPAFTSLVKNFSTKLVKTEHADSYSLSVSWETDHSAKAVKLRWRSVPRNVSISALNFSVSLGGKYSQVPSVTVKSNSGSGARVQPLTEIKEVFVASGGTGYTTAYVEAIGGGGSGASFSLSISGGTVSGIVVIAGGSDYTSLPYLQVIGDGTGASAYVSGVSIADVSVIQQGGGYFSSPDVIIDSTYEISPGAIDSFLSLANEGRIDYIRVLNGGTGYTGASVSITGSSYLDDAIATATIVDGSVESIQLQYSGYGYTASSVSIAPTGTAGSGAIAQANIDMYSQWFYSDPFSTEKTAIIEDLKYNIPYEIEILASQDELFRGYCKYTNLTNFQYYK